MRLMNKTRSCSRWMVIAWFLISALQGAIAAPSVTQLATQLYPDHTLLQLSAKTTSGIQAAIQKASRGSPDAAASIMVVLSNGAGSTLVVDKALSVEAGQSLVLTTLAALEAAAAGDAAAALSPADLLVVQCRASKTGDFIYASEFSSLELLGLSVQGCTAPAITAEDGNKMKLFNTHLLGNKAEDGAALLLTNVQQVELKRVTCNSNYATGSGGCLNAYRGGEIVATDSVFRANKKSEEPTGGLLDGGAAIFAQLLARLTVTRCEFSHNAALYGNGGAIFCSNCEGMTITASKFTNNSAVDTGGAVFAGEVGLVTITDSNFTSNGPLPKAAGAPAAANGGAVGLQGTRTGNKYPVNLVVRGCMFTQNKADVAGAVYGAQYNAGKGRMEIHDSIFKGNKGATEGGAVFMEENLYSELIVNSSVFEGNIGGIGGAVDAYDSDVLVADCTFTANEATDADGGAIQAFTSNAVGSGNKLTVVRSTFTENYASVGGGAVLADGQSLEIQDVVFTANEATFGGAVSVANAPTVAVTSSVFENNTAVGRGGGLRAVSAAQAALQGVRFTGNKGLDGGGIYMALVSTAAFTNLNLTSNTARASGGGVAIIGPSNVTWTTGRVSDNMAPLGAGLAADSNTLHMEGVEFTSNAAQVVPEEEKEGSNRRKLQQAGPAAISLYQFASQVYSQATAGAVLAQQSALHLSGCNLSANTADGDAGAVLVQRPIGLTLTDTTFDGNVAERGTAGGLLVIGAGPQVSADLKNCSFGANRAASGSGGAIVLNSGLGPLNVTCEDCRFEGNSAGQDGGAVAASGPTNFSCINCQSQDNSAAFTGGWISCRGCSQASITSGSSSNNSAGAAGGAVSCAGCGSLNTTQHEYSSNSAGAGGAVAVQTAIVVGMQGCTFDSNTADSNRTGAGTSAQMKRMGELPRTWQGIYGLGAAAAGVDCTGRGSGGGLCVDETATASIADNSLTNNRGSTGGAMFASAGCVDDSMNCQIQVTSLRATGNVASDAGGVLYTTTPHDIQLSDGSGSAIDNLHQEQLIQQLEQDNKVDAGGYGAAVASFPSELSMMAPQNELATMPTAVTAEQQPGQQRRKLQQLGTLAKTRDEIIDTVTDAFRFTSSAASGHEDILNPVCPLLGASVLDKQVVGVDSNQLFSLPIYILDAFSASVKSGPGSDWVVALQDKATGNIGQLSGASRARLQNGHAVLSDLSLQAEPGSNVTLVLTAIPPSGMREQPLSTDLTVQVRPCLAGQEAVFSNSSSTGSSVSMFCRTCAAPTFSFDAYNPGRNGEVCNTCPPKGLCVAGMLIPRQGAFQFHPRSAYIQECPNTKACLRSMDAMQNLQGLQCAYRRYNNSEAIDPRPYTALQCNTGYAGPYCSGCYRPGRNAWLALQMQRSAQRNSAGSGYTFADEVVLVKPRTTFDEGEVYGKSNGRCNRCPHIALAWIGFILARGLDMLFVAVLALLWMGFGWLSQSAAAAALRSLKSERLSDMRLRSTVFGSELMSALSIRSSGSIPPQMRNSASRDLAANNSASSSVCAGKGNNGSKAPNGANRGTQGPDAGASPFSADALQPAFSAGTNPQLQPEGSLVELLGQKPSNSPSSGILYSIYHAPSIRWESAVNMVNMLLSYQLGKADLSDAAEPMVVEMAAVLLLCVRHLACLVQTLLDGAQIAAILMSLDLLFFVPDWVATALSAVLMTQANTWQWVAFDCLLPGGSSASGAVVQTALALIMPLLYVAVLYPLLLSILESKGNNPSSFYRTCVQSKELAGPGTRQTGSRRRWSKFWPANGGATLLAALAIASMAYSYAFYVANVTAAFNCMSLGSRANLPGEVGISGSVWVPDMQLACGSGPHVAALLMAIVVGIPLLVGYWLLLLTLSWPADTSATDLAGPPVSATGRWSFLPKVWHLIKSALLLPARLLEPGVRACQQHASRAGLTGERCAGLGVWNVEWRWWWLFGREMIKLVLVVVATVTSMRGPDMQGRVMLFLIVIAAVVSWRVQAGCSTSMDQLQYVMWCWLQLLALLVLVPSLPGVSPTGYGAFLFALLTLVLLQAAVLLGCLVYRTLLTCRLMGAAAAADGFDVHDGYVGGPAAGQWAGSGSAGMPVKAVTSWKNPQLNAQVGP